MSTLPRSCAVPGCPRPMPCPEHTVARRRGQRQQRISKRMRAAQPWCTYCGSPNDLTIDHIVPLSQGGSNAVDNLTVACRRCNTSKHNSLVTAPPRSETYDIIIA